MGAAAEWAGHAPPCLPCTRSVTSAAQTPTGSRRAGAVPQAPPPGPLPDPLPHAVTGQERREPKRDNGRSEAQAPSSPERASVGEGDPRVVPAHARGARTTADSSRDALASLSRRVLQRLLVWAATSAGQTSALIRHGGVDLIETSAPVQGPPAPTATPTPTPTRTGKCWKLDIRQAQPLDPLLQVRMRRGFTVSVWPRGYLYMLAPNWSVNAPCSYAHAPSSVTRKFSPPLKASARNVRPFLVCARASRGSRRETETSRLRLKVRLPRSRKSEGRFRVFREPWVGPETSGFPRAGDKDGGAGKVTLAPLLMPPRRRSLAPSGLGNVGLVQT
ncbi:hypothetical protein J1605_016127 [Eschrichtius robustus]|uniref:Uncharacterized protein n=1 Tax=Eschrichtius robustus TaxID=9764 RepID=A0AB34G8L3_ESCRO|nr:hypothetical protein J1605_016127 [Eschrichtius robustus]